MGACSHENISSVPKLENETIAVRGREIVEGFGACGMCHSKEGTPDAPLSGGRLVGDKYGELEGPNITIGAGGLKGYTYQDIWRVFRGFKSIDERPVSKDAHFGFQWLSDRDLAGIVSYLRTLPPVNSGKEKRDISFFSRNTTGFLEADREVKGYVPEISAQFPKEYGKYIAEHVARCSACHDSNERLFSDRKYWAGGKKISFDGEERVAPNITSSANSGIGSWSDDDLKIFLMTGKKPDGSQVNSKFCPVEFFARAPSKEINALVTYAKTVTAVE